MKLYAIRVFVSDLASARRFYANQLGLPVIWETVESLGFDIGALLIVEHLHDSDGEADALIGRFIGASLLVDDLDAAYQQLSAQGVRFVGPPATQPWGGRLAHAVDPSGNILSFVDEA